MGVEIQGIGFDAYRKGFRIKDLVAHPARLERAACGFEVRRSIQLSYGCAFAELILH